jgi:hypothetical protein
MNKPVVVSASVNLLVAVTDIEHPAFAPAPDLLDSTRTPTCRFN